MKVLKVFGLAILSLLLFLSLVIFGAAFTVNSTLLQPEFIVSEVGKLDISSLAGEFLVEYTAENLPQEARPLEEEIQQVIVDVLDENEPWLKEQVSAGIHTAYDYLLGRSDELSLTISIQSLKDDLKETLRERLKPFALQTLPPEYRDAAQPLIDQYYDQYYDQFYREFAGQVPSEIQIDEGDLPSEAMEQLREVRQGISYFRNGYYSLIGLMAVLVIGIVLIGWRVRYFALPLGITFLLYGVLQYGAIFFGRGMLPAYIRLPGDMPPVLQSWAMGMVDRLVAPLGWFSLGMLGAGVVLVVVAIVVKPQEPED